MLGRPVGPIGEFHPEGIMGKVEHIIVNKGPTANPLSVDTGAVGASQVPNQQAFRSPDQNTMKFGDAFVVEFQIRLFGPTNQGQFPTKLDGSTAFNRYKSYSQPRVSGYRE